MSKKLPVSSKCYWCGKRATSWEHVPPKNLFPGVPDSQLIKVPACEKHNQKKSQLDDRFRFYLQAHRDSNQTALEQYKNKTSRGFNRPDRPGLKKSILKASSFERTESGPKGWTRVSQKHIQPYFEAITRGLYFHHAGKAGSIYSAKCFSPQFPTRTIPHEELLNSFMPILRSNLMVDGDYSSPEIFSYKYCIMPNRPIHFLVMMRFYEGLHVYGFFTLKGFFTFAENERIRREKILEKVRLQSRNEWNRSPGIPYHNSGK
jgi:hypothetical protein